MYLDFTLQDVLDNEVKFKNNTQSVRIYVESTNKQGKSFIRVTISHTGNGVFAATEKGLQQCKDFIKEAQTRKGVTYDTYGHSIYVKASKKRSKSKSEQSSRNTTE